MEQLHYMSATVFCDVTSCSLVEMYRRFKRTWNFRQRRWTSRCNQSPSQPISQNFTEARELRGAPVECI